MSPGLVQVNAGGLRGCVAPGVDLEGMPEPPGPGVALPYAR